MSTIRYHRADVDGFNIHYREAGDKGKPKLLLLHGYPSSGHMFRDLIPLLSDRFHIIAPDLPGFGLSDMPSRDQFTYTFDNIADVMDRFTEMVGFDRFAVYVFDYGAPTGFRLAVKHPERITAIISQNGNAYTEGLSDGWNPIQTYWEQPTEANREALRSFLSPEATRWQYTHGVKDESLISPDGIALDNYYPTGSAARLPQQRCPVSDLPGLFPQTSAAFPGCVGQARSVLPAAGRGSLQARHSPRAGALL
jgi:pimeloyl-ACP methyl ester carboxylesterase